MLRDEGARLADEESSIEVFRPPTGQVQWADDAGPFGRAESPPQLEEHPPKQAVIVGLAQAAARGPRAGRKKRRTTAPPSAAPSPPADQLGRVDTGELLQSLIMHDRAAKKAQGSPPPGRIHEQPTRVVGVDPERLLQQVAAAADDEEPTALVDFEQMIAEESAPPPHVFSDSVELEQNARGASPSIEVFASDSARRVPQTSPRSETFVPAREGEPRAHESPTRQVQLGAGERIESLSDVDFDFD